MKNASKQVVFAGVQPAILFKRQKTIAVPLVSRFDRGVAAEKIERRRSIECRDFDAMLNVFDVHLPIASMSRGVIVPIVDESFACKVQRRICAN